MARIDEAVFMWINGWVGTVPVFDRVVGWVVSDYLVPVCLILTLLTLWFAGRDRETRQRYQIGVLATLTAMGLTSWAVFLINGAYFRVRPFVDHEVSLLFYKPTDPSFPAQSAAAAFVIAAGVWGFNRRLGGALFLVAAFYGFTRVYAGVHYPLDIAAGAGLGIVIAFLVLRLMDLLRPMLVMFIRVIRVFVLA